MLTINRRSKVRSVFMRLSRGGATRWSITSKFAMLISKMCNTNTLFWTNIMPDIKFFSTHEKFRQWLERHHDTASELWLGFYRLSARKKGITYAEAVDEALCFGWIDGIRKSIDDESYTNRFTPRKPKSNWSNV